MHVSVDRKNDSGGKLTPEDQKQTCGIGDLRCIVQMQKHWDIKKATAEAGHPSDDSSKLEREVLGYDSVCGPIVPVT
jgi:hypothetical protein